MLKLLRGIYRTTSVKTYSRSQNAFKRCYCSQFSDEKKDKKDETKKTTRNPHVPAIRSPFESISDKSKEAYMDMITIFENKDIRRRNHVEFIYAALRNMEDFELHTDLEVYKALINVMPKGKFVPTNIFQAEFMHYPKQQQCIIDLLEQMEDNGVIPDAEMELMLLNIFGRKGHPLRKYWRMMYWMPKFKNLSPWPLPNPVPNDALELAKLAVHRMCTVDLLSKVEVFETADVADSIDKTWIVSGMSSEQSELLQKHDTKKPIFIEGPYNIWIRNKVVNFFTLRGDKEPDPVQEEEEEDTDDVSNLRLPFFNRPPVKASQLAAKRSVHQQEDGTIFAICATGTSSQDSLLSWIRTLEKNGNSCLKAVEVVGALKEVPRGHWDNSTPENDKERLKCYQNEDLLVFVRVSVFYLDVCEC